MGPGYHNANTCSYDMGITNVHNNDIWPRLTPPQKIQILAVSIHVFGEGGKAPYSDRAMPTTMQTLAAMTWPMPLFNLCCIHDLSPRTPPPCKHVQFQSHVFLGGGGSWGGGKGTPSDRGQGYHNPNTCSYDMGIKNVHRFNHCCIYDTGPRLTPQLKDLQLQLHVLGRGAGIISDRGQGYHNANTCSYDMGITNVHRFNHCCIYETWPPPKKFKFLQFQFHVLGEGGKAPYSGRAMPTTMQALAALIWPMPMFNLCCIHDIWPRTPPHANMFSFSCMFFWGKGIISDRGQGYHNPNTCSYDMGITNVHRFNHCCIYATWPRLTPPPQLK